jgi:Putative Flp pilus-assembly TadE/G-like
VGARTGVRPGDAGFGDGLGREDGNILVVIALFLPLFLIVCAVVIDVGYWWANAKKTQIAADACALAAARDLPATWTARPDCMFDGRDYALTNLPLEGLADEPRHRRTSVTSPYAPENATYAPTRYVEARVTLTVRTFFGRVVGLGHIDITRRAVAEKQPPEGDMAIYAHSDNCGFSLKFNGEDHNVEGGVHGNGAWQQNGEDFFAGSATYVPGCSSPHPLLTSGETTFGEGPSAVPEQDWPEWFRRSDFTCDVSGSTIQISSDFANLGETTYCANEFTISGRQVSGKITVVARKITINNRDHTFTPNEHGVLFFTPPNSTPTPPNDDDEQSNYDCDPDPALEMVLNGENYHWEGIIMSPCGRIKFNGQDAVAGTSHLLGQIIANEVEINGRNFNMTGTGSPTGEFELALFE